MEGYNISLSEDAIKRLIKRNRFVKISDLRKEIDHDDDLDSDSRLQMPAKVAAWYCKAQDRTLGGWFLYWLAGR
jgi:hypothetical protein